MGSAFSRAQAMNAKNNASTAILRSALTNYINATKNMNANKIRAALNNKRIGLTESYKNRIANAVANVVIKARKANVAVAAANAGVVPETATAAAVQQATTAVNNLNKIAKPMNVTTPTRGFMGLGSVTKGNNENMNENVYRAAKNQVRNIVKRKNLNSNNKKANALVLAIPTLNYNKLKNIYNNKNNNRANIIRILNLAKTKPRPAAVQRLNNTLKANNTLTGNMFNQANNYTPTPNNTVNTGKKIIGVKQKNGKYMLVFKNSMGKWARANTVNYNTKNAALNAGGAGGAAPPATANNRFKNMNINTLVKSAAQTLTNENKVKLKAAIKAKMNTLNENSMNRVRLVNANRNLN
jgi:hypothetical protein